MNPSPSNTNLTTGEISIQNNVLLFRLESPIKLYLDYQLSLTNVILNTLQDTLLIACHDVLYNHLPFDNLELKIAKSIIDFPDKGLTTVVVRIAQILVSTNDFLSTISPAISQPPTKVERQEHVLIYDTNSSDLLIDLHDKFNADGLQKSLYRNMSTGFNSTTRTHENATGLMSPEELTTFIIEHNVKQVISINMYLLELIFKQYHIFILAIFKKLDVEYIIIDWDLYGISMNFGLNKAAYNYSGFSRYSIYPNIEEKWDTLLGMKNVSYYPYHFSQKQSITFHSLQDNYKILLATNSRVKGFYQPLVLERVLEAIEFTDDANIFHQFQFWYHTLLYFVLHHLNCDQTTKLKLRYLLMNIHFQGIALLKFEVIDQISIDRELLLFGDDLLGDLFPHYYQQRYCSLDEMYSMLKSKEYLYLQVNNIFSYPEPNPVMSRAINAAAPFIGFPAVVKTPELEPLQQIEYRGIEELNHKLDTINDIYSNTQVVNTLNTLNGQMADHASNFELALLTNQPSLNSGFHQHCLAHRYLFNPLANHYIHQNQDKIEDFINNLLQKRPFDIEQSRMANRSYVKKIIALRDSHHNIE